MLLEEIRLGLTIITTSKHESRVHITLTIIIKRSILIVTEVVLPILIIPQFGITEILREIGIRAEQTLHFTN